MKSTSIPPTCSTMHLDGPNSRFSTDFHWFAMHFYGFSTIFSGSLRIFYDFQWIYVDFWMIFSGFPDTDTKTRAPGRKKQSYSTHDTSRQTWPKQQEKWLMRHGDTLRNHDDNMMIFVVWRNHGGKRHRELKHERKLCPTHHLKSRWDRVLEQGRTETVPTIRMED